MLLLHPFDVSGRHSCLHILEDIGFVHWLLKVLEGQQSMPSLKQVEDHAKQNASWVTAHATVDALKGLSSALIADLEGLQEKLVSFTTRVELKDRIGSQERQHVIDQIERHALRIQHSCAAASRARAAACSVLERVFCRLDDQSRFMRVAFTMWRGIAERQALAACAHRAQELEDWVTQARESNRNRISALLQHNSEAKQRMQMQWLLLVWKCTCRMQVRKASVLRS